MLQASNNMINNEMTKCMSLHVLIRIISFSFSISVWVVAKINI